MAKAKTSKTEKTAAAAAKGIAPAGAATGEQGRSGEATPRAVSDQERRRRIAENAYYRAQQRGFEGGDPLDDWLAAEREINRALPRPAQQKEELAIDAKLRAQLRELFDGMRDSINAATIRESFDKARQRLRDAGEHTAETIDRVAGTIEKEIAEAAHQIGPKWESLSERTASLFEGWRRRSSNFLNDASQAMRDWLTQAGARLERPVYHAGEVVSDGYYECLACGSRVHLQTPGHLPPCSRCYKSDFRRV